MSTFFFGYTLFFSISFILVAIVWRSMLLYRKQGINPVTFGRSSETAHDYVGKWFKLIIFILLIHVCSQRLVSLPVIYWLDSDIAKYAGIILTAASFILVVIAQHAMGNSWRIGIDEKHHTSLITKGPFKYIRNPIFLGMIVANVGLFLLVPTYLMSVFIFISYILINVQIRLEEEFLERVHGQNYLIYKSKTGRLLPKLLS